MNGWATTYLNVSPPRARQQFHGTGGINLVKGKFLAFSRSEVIVGFHVLLHYYRLGRTKTKQDEARVIACPYGPEDEYFDTAGYIHQMTKYGKQGPFMTHLMWFPVKLDNEDFDELLLQLMKGKAVKGRNAIRDGKKWVQSLIGGYINAG